MANERPSLGDISEYALDHAPAELIQEFLACLLRLQQASAGIEQYLERRRFLDLKTQIDEYEPVDIRLSDGRLMRLGCTKPSCQSHLCLRRPTKRADCPVGKPCPHIRCSHHIWRIDGGEDGSRAGRPGLSSVPRDAMGLTLKASGDLGGERAGTTLEARWLEYPVPPSCALDLADRGPMTNTQMGSALGRHRTLPARILRRALGRAIENAEGMGMSRDDLLKGLREIGAGS